MTPGSGRAALGCVLCLAAIASWPVRSGAADDFDRETVQFTVRVNTERTSLDTMFMPVMPGGTVSLEIVDGRFTEYEVEAEDGVLVRPAPKRWTWRAPEKPGVYELEIVGLDARTQTRQSMTVRGLVMVPASRQKNGFLNNYRMGQYPAKPLNGNPVYRAPAGFIEVTRDNEDTRLTPHFRLKQFVCKQEPIAQYPKYVLVQPRLVLHLETLLALVNELGHRVDTLHVMSGYRTPYYNAVLRDAVYSMHQFGGAADVFVDKDDKFRMDDLNRDGRVDVGDAKFLASHVDRLVRMPAFRLFEGGIGVYPATAAHPPFVHVDVRGTAARWGE